MAAIAVEMVGVSPRLLSFYIESRASGHSAPIVNGARSAARLLVWLDRREIGALGDYPGWRGSNPRDSDTMVNEVARGRVVSVETAEQTRAAISRAVPGDVITLQPGTYRFSGRAIPVDRAGAAPTPIIVRAERLGTVILEFELLEGFHVSAPYWKFENLVIRGVCSDDSDCEHAFHVVGGGARFSARNNYLQDFNAHIKVNGAEGRFPDDGVIENSTLVNSHVRRTDNPVTPIDLVAASHWRIEGNLIADFVKGEGDQTSYGAFAKGGGSGNQFLRNVVLCEHRLQGKPGRRVALSFGGGGSERYGCRDQRCIVEHEVGLISDNLIAACSDVGIYLNRAARSVITHNTILDSAGIMVRYPESTADVQGNLVDGPIRRRDGALLRDVDNQATPVAGLYLGLHPVRRHFADVTNLNLAWRATPPRRDDSANSKTDLCDAMRPPSPTYGAFEDIAACERR